MGVWPQKVLIGDMTNIQYCCENKKLFFLFLPAEATKRIKVVAEKSSIKTSELRRERQKGPKKKEWNKREAKFSDC